MLPADAARRERVFGVVREVFRRHGFDPLDTPAFERLEVLTGKYGDEGDQLIFKILRRGEHEATGEADLALRYDLTVPLARVVARYGSQLPTPFKRYQIAPVWRADRPARGRFREFVQCDVDTVGSDSLAADAATIVALADALDALGLRGYRVLLNSRKALAGLVEAYGIPESLEGSTLVALDKLAKIGFRGVAAELGERGVPQSAIDALANDLSAESPIGEGVLSPLAAELKLLGAGGGLAANYADRMRERLGETERGAAGLAEVDRVRELVGDLRGGQVIFEPVLARGLGYYTGPVFEVVHDDLDVTIAAGGRYDGLVGMFQGQAVPATGGSLGLERILLLLESQEEDAATGPGVSGPQVLVAVLDDDGLADAIALARVVREAGFSAEAYPGAGRLGKQLSYANQRGARLAVLRGAAERDAGTVTIKDLDSGEQATHPLGDLEARVCDLLGD